jgi:hypothetical protein
VVNHREGRFAQGAPGVRSAVPQPDEWLFIGDSPNDEPLFASFSHSVGVANLARYLPLLEMPPRWFTDGSSGAGFCEMAARLIVAHHGTAAKSAAPAWMNRAACNAASNRQANRGIQIVVLRSVTPPVAVDASKSLFHIHRVPRPSDDRHPLENCGISSALHRPSGSTRRPK